MTAAVMSSVPRARAGMASATSNASREIGGVFGIALLGAIVTHWFASDLASRLTTFPLSPALKGRVVDLASHGGAQVAAGLPAGTAARLHVLVDSAFVSGLHVGFLVSAAALAVGAMVSVVFVKGGRPIAEVIVPAGELVVVEEGDVA
jgi:hypothetical protein